MKEMKWLNKKKYIIHATVVGQFQNRSTVAEQEMSQLGLAREKIYYPRHAIYYPRSSIKEMN